ncbi:hypothetical protein C9439_06960 [archaeon SCG-AAA382B04]|nr:hypothetical protein C9439_06960 [archaeon SCG-AAA382B04]
MTYSNENLTLKETEISRIGFHNFFRKLKTEFEINISKLELNKDNNRLLATQGKIELTFKRDASWELISEALSTIAEIDKNAEHEITVKMNYDEIEEHEKEGYVLVSYGKIKGDLYKVIFEIPFSNNSALKKLALSIYNSEERTTKDVIWNGGDQRIVSLLMKLKDSGWKIQNLELVKDKKVNVGFSSKGYEYKEFKKQLSESIK